jgi:hypothetical protein
MTAWVQDVLLCAARGEASTLLDALLLKPAQPGCPPNEWVGRLSTLSMKRALGVLLCSGELLRLQEDRRESVISSSKGDDEEGSNCTSALLNQLAGGSPRRVCQYAFRKNDIVWICRTCQADETCVLCNSCYRGSNHAGHEVFFYHAQAGGCCDCGDPDAWAASGFCKEHGGGDQDPLRMLPPALISAAQTVLTHVIESLRAVAIAVKQSYSVTPAGGEEATSSCIFLLKDETKTREDLSRSLVNICHLGPHEIERTLVLLDTHGEFKLPVADQAGLLPMVTALKDAGLLVSLRSSTLRARENRARLVLDWLLEVSSVSDGTCRLVCERLDEVSLYDLMICDSFFSPELRESLHKLYLALMADQPFKTRIAAAYTRALVPVTRDYARGVGISESCIFTLSVQFLNRSIFVNTLVEQHGFLSALSHCLLATLAPPARVSSTPRGACALDTSHPCLRYRRYMPVVADLKCVLNIEGVPQRFLGECFWPWIRVLGLVHGAGVQRRRLRTHVDYEPRDWMYNFNINISLCSVFEHMTSWLRSPPVPGADNQLPMQARAPGSEEEPSAEQIQTLLCELPDEGQSPGGIGFPCSAGQLFRGMLRTLRAWHALQRGAAHTFSEGGRLLLPPAPSARSFHPTLHRFFASAVREACKFSGRVGDVEMLARELKNDADGGLEFNLRLVDAPLLSLALSAEISAGLWRRNGQVMNDQLLNYAEPPFCRMFRDLDLLAVQVASLAYGSRLLVDHILQRYHCWRWIYPKGPDVPFVVAAASAVDDNEGDRADPMLILAGAIIGEQSALSVLLHPSSPRGIFADRTMHLNEEAPSQDGVERSDEAMDVEAQIRRDSSVVRLDASKQLAMVEECILLFTLLVTEIPRPPDALAQIKSTTGASSITVNARVVAEVRRELIHRLACGPCTHSELQDACSLVGQADSMPLGALETILQDVAVPVSAASPLEPGRYTLKNCARTEYDPSFWHVSLNMHQTAMEQRLSSRKSEGDSATPICPPPPLVHPVFYQVRLGLTTEGALVDLIARVLGRDQVDTLLLRTLHLLTVIIHVLKSEAATAAASALESAAFARPDAVLQSERREPEAPVSLSLIVCERLLERGVVGELLSLDEGDKLKGDQVAASGVRWILRQLKAMDQRCADLMPDRSSAADGEANGGQATALRAAARERALASIRRNAALFSASADDGESAADAEGTSSLASPRASSLSSVPECIVCREATADSLGFVAFSQCSAVLGAEPASCGIHVQSCGHALHRSCFDQYFLTVCQHSEGGGHLTLDVNRGEYQCPLCKRLANSLLPNVPSLGAAGACSSLSTPQESSPAANIREAIAATSPSATDDPVSSTVTAGQCGDWRADVDLFFQHVRETEAGGVPGATPADRMTDFTRVAGSVAYTVASYALELQDLEGFGYGASCLTSAENVARLAHLRRLARVLQGAVRSCYLSEKLCKMALAVVTPSVLVTPGEAVDEAPVLCGNMLTRLALLLSSLPQQAFKDATLLVCRAKALQLLLARWVETSQQKVATLEELLCQLPEQASVCEELLPSFVRSACIMLEAFSDFEDTPQKPLTWENLGAELSEQSQTTWTSSGDTPLYRHWVADFWLRIPSKDRLIVATELRHHYPPSRPVELSVLPHAYTDLHSFLSAYSDIEHPAICLICGTVLRAEGTGDCTSHAAQCGQGVGLLFLQHECSALLIHGVRAAYFPSPYVDTYGERHRNFRGRPLFLDQRRLALLRSVYKRHAVPQEVVQIRSASRAVIRNNFY